MAEIVRGRAARLRSLEDHDPVGKSASLQEQPGELNRRGRRRIGKLRPAAGQVAHRGAISRFQGTHGEHRQPLRRLPEHVENGPSEGECTLAVPLVDLRTRQRLPGSRVGWIQREDATV